MIRLWDRDGEKESSLNNRVAKTQELATRVKKSTRKSTRIADVVGSYADAGDVLTR